jgi:hypothetical protein
VEGASAPASTSASRSRRRGRSAIASVAPRPIASRRDCCASCGRQPSPEVLDPARPYSRPARQGAPARAQARAATSIARADCSRALPAPSWVGPRRPCGPCFLRSALGPAASPLRVRGGLRCAEFGLGPPWLRRAGRVSFDAGERRHGRGRGPPHRRQRRDRGPCATPWRGSTGRRRVATHRPVGPRG